MITIKIEQGEKPSEIFKKIANAEAELEHCRTYTKPTLPKRYQTPKPLKNNAGWRNFCNLVRQLNP